MGVRAKMVENLEQFAKQHLKEFCWTPPPYFLFK
jgi:phage-related protein